MEQAIRERVAVRRPGYAVLGEEAGLGDALPRPSPRGRGEPCRARWIVDPIDGTRKFVRGIPIFATLLALELDGEIVVGVASAPLMADAAGAGGRRRASGRSRTAGSSKSRRVSRLQDAHVLHGSVEGFVRKGVGPALLDLSARCWGTTGPGDFWIHLLVAEGKAEAAVEPEAAIWDVAALKLIVEEAGGRFSDFAGRNTPAGGNAVSTNGLIHDEILAFLRA